MFGNPSVPAPSLQAHQFWLKQALDLILSILKEGERVMLAPNSSQVAPLITGTKQNVYNPDLANQAAQQAAQQQAAAAAEAKQASQVKQEEAAAAPGVKEEGAAKVRGIWFAKYLQHTPAASRRV